jgi:hypothetical protein
VLRQRVHPTHWAVESASDWSVDRAQFCIKSALKREYTSYLVDHCFEVGTSGNKNLNRFRFVIYRGQVERGITVLRKRNKRSWWYRGAARRKKRGYESAANIQLCENQSLPLGDLIMPLCCATCIDAGGASSERCSARSRRGAVTQMAPRAASESFSCFPRHILRHAPAHTEHRESVQVARRGGT